MALTKIKTGGIADNAITNAKIADDAIDSADFANASIDLAHMSVNSIDSDQYVDGSIDNVHVATGLDAVKLADGTVTNTEFQYINTLSSNAQTQISAKAPIASPTFTGNFTSVGIDDNADATAITIDSSENVGIGTSSPGTSRLFVDNATSTNYVAQLVNTTNNGAGVKIQGASGTGPALRVFDYAGNERMIVTGDGNVGIGVAAPTLNLVVASATNPTFQLADTTTGVLATDGFQLQLADSTAYVYNKENGDMIFGTNNTEAMRIDSAGNVGIGVTDPDSLLEIKATDPVLKISSGAGSAQGHLYWEADGTSKWHLTYNGGSGRLYLQDLADNSEIMAWKAGRVGIQTEAPAQVLDCNSGSGNMIADGYDTHSLAVYKENIENASGYLDKILACPSQKWNRKPFVSAKEIKEAVLNEFGEDIWNEHFPEESSHKQKALYNMPEGDLKTWIDDWCESKRVEMRPEDKWQKKRLGLVADDELTAEHLPEVIAINDDGLPTGIDTMTYIGILHNAVQELSAKVTALENA